VSGLEHLWAGWRGTYVSNVATAPEPDPSSSECLFERILAPGSDEVHFVVWRGDRSAVVLNAYPYTSGHLMVAPLRHVGELEDLEAAEAAELWSTVTLAVRALKGAYEPGGVNVGLNLGRPAGAGVPGHLHVHVLPRWNGDTNFMTTVAGVRILPETLADSWGKLRDAWPS
jgi:ATP adenylyltransferase